LPIIPVVASALVIILVMKFTKIIKNKEVVQYLSVFITLFLVVMIQFFGGSTGGNQNLNNEELANSIISKENMINNASNLFITIKPTLKIVENYNNINGIKSLCILFLESISVYFIVCLLIAKIYIKTATSIISMGNKKSKAINAEKVFVKDKLWKTYVKKEFKILVRNPIYFMQCVLPSLLFPIIFSIPVIMSYKDSGGEAIISYTNNLGEYINSQVGFAVTLIAILIMYIFNFIALTAISRDGRDSTFIKQIPVSINKQILYKILPGIILNIVPVIYVIGFEKVLVNSFDISSMIIIFITAMLANIFNNYLMILIDLKNPKLDWTTEYAVVKQNFNMFFQFIIIAVESGIIIGVCGFLEKALSEIILITAFLCGILIIRKYINKKQIKLFCKII
jgi:ABC-2 type transport system permease protein